MLTLLLNLVLYAHAVIVNDEQIPMVTIPTLKQLAEERFGKLQMLINKDKFNYQQVIQNPIDGM